MSPLKFAFVALSLYAVLILGTQATMSLSAGLVIAAALYFAWKVPRSRDEFGRGWKMYVELSFALVLSFVVSLLGAWLFPLTYGGHTALVHGPGEILKAWYFFWPPVVSWLLLRLDVAQRRRIFWMWLGVAGILGVIGVIQHWVGWPRPHEIPVEGDSPLRYHATLFLGHHLSVASVLIFPFFLGLDAWLLRLRRGQKRDRWKLAVGAVGIVMVGTTLVFTYSRTLWVALPIGLLIWVGLSLPRRVSAALFVVLFVGAFSLLQTGVVRDRMGTYMGVRHRLALWDVNWEFFKQRPVTGVGWLKNEELSGYALIEKSGNTHVFAGRAHNNFLEIIAGLGLLGFFVFCFWAFWITVRFWRLGRMAERAPRGLELPVAWGPLCAWVVFHLNGLTQVNLWEGKVLHQLLWVLAWAGVLRVLGQKAQARPRA